VNTGDNVTKGQTLLVLEAMKMENEIMAPADGVVQEVNVTQGVSVNAGDILIVLSS
jgi:biotin carboxyl carrier protein